MFSLLTLIGSAYALGEASTTFQVFVPPNNVTGRDVSVAITAVSDGLTVVDVVDDAADGDADDSAPGVVLSRGASYVLYPREGGVNDDAGGKADGDYLVIEADKPVTVLVATDSNWQHDWAPSDGSSSRGTSFLLWSPPTSGQPADLDVFAYEEGTVVTIEDITVSATTASGITQVDPRAGEVVLEAVLDAGEDLIRRHGLGIDLFREGHTYWVRASAPVTVQSGHLETLDGANQARDGGGFVPGASGGASSSLTYLSIPHNPGRTDEKELRAVAWEDYAEVSLYGWSDATEGWNLLDVAGIPPWGHADWVGASDPTFASYELYKVEVADDADVMLFEANWMETGAPGTSDYMSALTSASGTGSGTDFVAYLGPPGDQSNWAAPPPGGKASRVTVYAAEADAFVTLLDLDTNGATYTSTAVVPAGGLHDFVIDEATWTTLDDPAAGRRPYVLVRSDVPVSVTTGNVNDNFMAYLTSPLQPDPTVTVEVGAEGLSCGASTLATVTMRHSLGGTLTDGELVLSVPLGVDVDVLNAPGFGVPVAVVDGVALSAPDVSSGDLQTVELRLSYPCDGTLACPTSSLSTLTARRDGTHAGLRYATNASASIALEPWTGDTVEGLTASWNPALGAAVVSWDVVEPSAGTRWALQRATAPEGPYAELEVVYGAADVSRYLTTDGAVAQGQTLFYRIEALGGDGCPRAFGPVALEATSAPSGAAGSGLESNGRLAAALARRAVARSHGWDPELEPRSFRSSALDRLFPTTGPAGSAPVEATPWDLPGVTNALDAQGRDYVLPDGTHVASVLVVQTVDQPYEHSKALCDRAGGSTLTWAGDTLFSAEGAVPRARLASTAGSVDWSTQLVLTQAPGEAPRAWAPWLVEQLPMMPEGTVFTTVQTWSGPAGFDLALAEDVATLMGATDTPTAWPAPATWVRQVSTLGGALDVHLDGMFPADIELSARREDGRWEHWHERVSAPRVALATGPALEVTATVLGPDGAAIDHVWASDGAWAPFDDGIWEGATRALTFDGLCPEGTAGASLDADGVVLAGCAEASVDVAPGGFGGVARHLASPVAAGQAVAVHVTADEPIWLCAHSVGGQRPCASFAAQPAGGWLAIDLEAAERMGLGLETIDLVEVFTEAAGPATVAVSGLTLLDEVPAFASEPEVHPLPGASVPAGAAGSGGCATASPRGGWLWSLVLVALGRRRASSWGRRGVACRFGPSR